MGPRALWAALSSLAPLRPTKLHVQLLCTTARALLHRACRAPHANAAPRVPRARAAQFINTPRARAAQFTNTPRARAAQFINENRELLATIPPPMVALNYYLNEDLYLFDS